MTGKTLSAALRDGKYTDWAAELNETQLVGLIWLVGEFSVRSSGSEFAIDDEVGGQRRKVAALKALASFPEEPMGVHEVRKYITETNREGDRAAVRRRLEGAIVVADRGLEDGDVASSLRFVKNTMATLIKELTDKSDV